MKETGGIEAADAHITDISWVLRSFVVTLCNGNLKDIYVVQNYERASVYGQLNPCQSFTDSVYCIPAGISYSLFIIITTAVQIELIATLLVEELRY